MKTASILEGTPLVNAAHIAYASPAEAQFLARVELGRMLALLDSLAESDWHQPTACTAWDVRAILAHQAGAYASGTGYGELLHQYLAVLKPGRLPEDSINERQLRDRASRAPAELIAELRKDGDKAIYNWSYGFRPLKLAGIPHPTPGWLSMRHLMLVIHSRDTWIHRLDICRATGRAFEQTKEHDGRITALVVRDLARSVSGRLGGAGLVLSLGGVSGGNWQIGRGKPTATIQMDCLDFHTFASGRMTHDDASRRTAFAGDNALAERAFRGFAVLY